MLNLKRAECLENELNYSSCNYFCWAILKQEQTTEMQNIFAHPIP